MTPAEAGSRQVQQVASQFAERASQEHPPSSGAQQEPAVQPPAPDAPDQVMEDAVSAPSGLAANTASQPSDTQAQEVEEAAPDVPGAAAGTVDQPKTKTTLYRLEQVYPLLASSFLAPESVRFRFQGLLKGGRRIHRLQGLGNEEDMARQKNWKTQGHASFIYQSVRTPDI